MGLPARLWRRVLRWPLAALVLVVLVQTGFTLWSKDVWYPDELRHAAVLRGLLEDGHWLVLYLGGDVYPDKPPLYFWALAGLARLTGSTKPEIFMLAASLSGMIFLAAVLALARALHLGRRVGLLAGFILLSNWFFMDRLHQPRMDLLFSALILLSHAAFFLALRPEGKPHAGWAAAGGALALAAVLTKGPVGAAFPALAVAVWLGWQGRVGLMWSRQMLVGWGTLGAGALVYLAGIWLVGGGQTLRLMLVDQTLSRALGQTRNVEPFWWYLPVAAMAFLPWTFLLGALPWVGPAAGPVLDMQRRAAAGRAYLIAALGTGTLLLSAIGYKVVQFLLPMWGLVALAAALVLIRLSARARLVLFTAIAALLAVAAVLLPTLAPGWTTWPDAVKGAPLDAIAVAVAAALAFLARRRRALQAAAILCLAMSGVVLPFYLITIHGLDRVMSPRPAAAILVSFAAHGYDLVEYHPYYLGHFNYHSGREIPGLQDPAALRVRIGAHACGVVALRRRDLEALPPDLRQALQAIYTFRLDTETYQLATWGRAGRTTDATAPEDCVP